jgi:DNA-binding NarL/FixJ family response regulator
MSTDSIRPSRPETIQHARDTIIAVDARTLERGCMARVLASEFDEYQIVEADTAAALSRSAQGRPRLVILRIHPEQQSGAAIAQDLAGIRRSCPDASVALVCDDDERSLYYALQHGCQGYLPTSMPLEIAVAALRLVLVGGQYFPQPARIPEQVPASAPTDQHTSVETSQVAGVGTDRECSIAAPVFANPGVTRQAAAYAASERIVATHVEKTAAFEFTPREREVIEALRCGRSNKVIASDLSLSENTVKVHVRHIMRKLSATNRTQAALRSQLLFSASDVVN